MRLLLVWISTLAYMLIEHEGEMKNKVKRTDRKSRSQCQNRQYQVSGGTVHLDCCV